MNIISELEIYLDKARATQGDNILLAKIMTDMERRYKIPLIANLLPDWMGKNANGERILNVYRYISGLRTF